MRRVVSVSLGSSRRDKAVEVTLGGERFRLERTGTDGDVAAAGRLIQELDGRVDCIGLGGMDRYLWLGNRRYTIRQVDRLARLAERTPVVDGSGLKRTMEPRVLQRLVDERVVKLEGRRVLMMCAVDRYGVAERLPEYTSQIIYGDIIFAVGVRFPMRSLRMVHICGTMLLPLMCRLPMSMLYPTGGEQESTSGKYARYLEWAEVIIGDFHFIRRHLPQDLSGRAVITNTTTEEDVASLRERGVSVLATTTPAFEGRTFGNNVMEGVVVSLSGKRPEELSDAGYMRILDGLGWQPRVELGAV